MTASSALNVLILGGSSEASALARALAGDPRFAPVLSLAGRTEHPAPSPIPRRVGGFGGAEGLARHLEAMEAGALVVALHPFAARMRAAAIQAVRLRPTPCLLIERRPWRAGAGDRWASVPDMAAAVVALGQEPRRVLLTVGGQELTPFVEGPAHHYLVRSIDPPPRLPAGAELILARGPFVEADERRLLQAHGIEVVVTKNAGGAATGAKLHAARALGLRVVLVDRPPAPDLRGVEAQQVEGAEAALAWLEHQASSAATKRGV